MLCKCGQIMLMSAEEFSKEKKKEKETTDSAKFVAKLKGARNSTVQHCSLGTESRKAGENSPENWEKS